MRRYRRVLSIFGRIAGDSRKRKSKAEIALERQRTLSLCACALIIYELDAILVGADSKPLTEEFALSLSGLGFLMIWRAITQALLMPVWGYLCDRYSRKALLALGMLLWGVDAAATSVCSQEGQLMTSRALAGVGLAAVLPIVHSLVADFYEPEERGFAFGWLGFAEIIGGVVGVFFATNVGVMALVMGMHGWRFTFAVTGLLSVLVGALTMLLAGDPERGGSEHGAFGHGATAADEGAWDWAGRLFRCKTFILIMVRSAFDGIPNQANTMLILWYQYIGFSEMRASWLTSVQMIGMAISSILGGIIADRISVLYPTRGRLNVAEFGVCTQITMTYVFYKLLPMPMNAGGTEPIAHSYYWFMIAGFAMSIVGNWDQQACDLPLLSEVVGPEDRGIAYGIVDCLQVMFGFVATGIVGWAAESMFGFVNMGAIPVEDWSGDVRRTNTVALASALVFTVCTALACSLATYLSMHLTYASDRAALEASIQARLKSAGQEGETVALRSGH